MVKYVIGGNWKMFKTVGEAVETAKAIADAIKNHDKVDVFIAAPYTALYSVGNAIKGTNLKLAAQNMYFRDSGAFTGEISPDFLLDCGCEYVLLGHSERRRIFGETSEYINQKVVKALEKGLKPVVCIGETMKERTEGNTEKVNIEQLDKTLKDVEAAQMKNVVIAYEPVWAINNKFLNPDMEPIPATPEQAKEVHAFVRKWLVEKYGAEIGSAVPIQYGGSMNGKNAEELLAIENINGGLIGGASLTAEQFEPIIKIAQSKSQ
jgi:triosephosphate isomerase